MEGVPGKEIRLEIAKIGKVGKIAQAEAGIADASRAVAEAAATARGVRQLMCAARIESALHTRQSHVYKLYTQKYTSIC